MSVDFAPSLRSGLRGRILQGMNKRSGAQRRYHPSSPFQAPPAQVIEEFELDDRVTHDKYGLGRVIAVDGASVTVDFGSHKVRIPSPFDKMTKL